MRLLDGINDTEDELYTFDSIIESKTTSSSLEELKRIKNYKELTYIANITGYEKVNRKLAYNDELKGSFAIIEKELKELDKIKARLSVVKMKLISKRKECVKNMEHTDEDDFVHEASKIEMDIIDWFIDMINEELL